MSNITIAVFAIFIAIWVYSFISVIRNEFKEPKKRVFWIIALLFVPFLAFFYIFMKKNLLK